MTSREKDFQILPYEAQQKEPGEFSMEPKGLNQRKSMKAVMKYLVQFGSILGNRGDSTPG